MLIEAPYATGDVVSVRLSSGEEIVGKLLDDNEKTIKLKQPLSAIMSEKGLAMLPFMLTVNPEADLVVNKNQIMITAKSIKEVADHYLQSTTGITLGV
tara:strand:- start:306 stop:599 length:294 start_codon:yes stop_codon:yes gene_type:complete